MKTTKIEYVMPAFLPFGWQKEVANILGIHRNTLYNALKQGDSHPQYNKIFETVRKKYGKPINIEIIK